MPETRPFQDLTDEELASAIKQMGMYGLDPQAALSAEATAPQSTYVSDQNVRRLEEWPEVTPQEMTDIAVANAQRRIPAASTMTRFKIQPETAPGAVPYVQPPLPGFTTVFGVPMPSIVAGIGGLATESVLAHMAPGQGPSGVAGFAATGEAPITEAVVQGQIDWYRRLASDPIETIKNEPFGVALEMLALTPVVGWGIRLARGTKAVKLASQAGRMRQLLVARGIAPEMAKRVSAPLLRAIEKADASRIKGLTAELQDHMREQQALMARAETTTKPAAEALEVAKAGEPTGALTFTQATGVSEEMKHVGQEFTMGAMRGQRPLARLAAKEVLLAEREKKIAKSLNEFESKVEQYVRSPDRQALIDPVQKNFDKFSMGQLEFARAEIAAIVKAVPVESGNVRMLMQRQRAIRKVQNKYARRIAIEQAKAEKKVAKIQAIPDDIASKKLRDKALRKYQQAVEKANNQYDAALTDLTKRTANELAGMNLFDLWAEGETISGTKWLAAKHWMSRAVDFNSPLRRMLSVFGRESALLGKTPYGFKFSHEAQSAETIGRVMEHNHIERLGDKAIKLTRGQRAWVEKYGEDYYENFFSKGHKGFYKNPDTGLLEEVPEQIRVTFAQTGHELKRAWEIEDATNRAAGGPGVPFIEGYLPHTSFTEDLKMAFVAKSGPVWDAVAKWVYETHGIPEAELRGVANEVFKSYEVGTGAGHTRAVVHYQPNIEKMRTLNLPPNLKVHTKLGVHNVRIRESNPLVSVSQYFREASRRVGIWKKFGLDNKKFSDMLDATGADARTRDAMIHTWEALQGLPHPHSVYNNPFLRLALGMEAVARAAQLSLAVIPNITGIMWVARKWGLKNTLEAQWEVLQSIPRFGPNGLAIQNPVWTKDAELLLDMNRKSAGWARNSLAYQAETELMGTTAEPGARTVLGTTQSFSRQALSLTGLGKVDRNTNKVCGVAAEMGVEDLLERLRDPSKLGFRKLMGASPEAIVRELKRDFIFDDADIARMVKNGLSQEDRARIVQRSAAMVNAFSEGAMNRRRWMRHPLAQRALAYSSFRRIRGHMVADAVSEAAKGNVIPFMKELGYTTVSGAAAREFRDFLTNKGRYYEDFWDRLYEYSMESASYGYLGAVSEAYRYSASDAWTLSGRVGSMVMPPFVDFMDDIVTAADNIMTGQEWYKEVARAIPAVQGVRGTYMRIREMGGDKEAAYERAIQRHTQEMRSIREKMR